MSALPPNADIRVWCELLLLPSKRKVGLQFVSGLAEGVHMQTKFSSRSPWYPSEAGRKSKTNDGSQPGPETASCPLYPRKRTFSGAIEMSAKCQKQTSRVSGCRASDGSKIISADRRMHP